MQNDTIKLAAGMLFSLVLAFLFVWQALTEYQVRYQTLFALLVLIAALFRVSINLADLLGPGN